MASLPNLSKPQQSAAEHATDFEPPIYNIWKQKKKTENLHSHYRRWQRPLVRHLVQIQIVLLEHLSCVSQMFMAPFPGCSLSIKKKPPHQNLWVEFPSGDAFESCSFVVRGVLNRHEIWMSDYLMVSGGPKSPLKRAN